MSNLLDELKRRKVFRVAAVYAVVAWVLIQVADTVMPALQMPDWTVSFVTVLFILGFPIAVILAWAYEVTPGGIRADAVAHTASPAQSTSLHPVNYLILAIVLIVAGFQIADRFVGSGGASRENSIQSASSAAESANPIRLELTLPENFNNLQGNDISPDGTKIVFSGRTENGQQPGLWLRSLDDLSVSFIPGTGPLSAATITGSRNPRFSPDGQSIVFERSGRIETVSLEGTAQRILVEQNLGTINNALWGRDDMIYYGGENGGIWRIPASGGVAEEVLAPVSEEYSVLYLIDLLPEGRGILYKPSRGEIAVASFETGERKIITEGDYSRYAPTGHLVFSNSNGNLIASRLDLSTLELSDYVTLPDSVPPFMPVFSISDNGTLVYLSTATSEDEARRVELVWVNRAGEANPVDPGWDFLRAANAGWSLSPDGNRIAYQTRADIWIKELPGGPEQRLTLSGGSLSTAAAEARHPAWSPDGQLLTYILTYRGSGPVLPSFDVWQVRADGTGDPRLWVDDPERGFGQPIWTHDGSMLIMRTLAEPETGPRDIVGVRPDEEEVIPLIGTPQFGEQSPAPSPDGRWLAYTSDESGQEQVFVRPYPDVNAGRWQVSVDGGISPLWAGDSDELVFVDADRNVVSARLDTENMFRVVEREILFTLGPEYYIAANNEFWDITQDGQQFLMARSIENPRLSLVVVQDFYRELGRLMGED